MALGKAKVSLCMIVKDEEALLPDCVQSVSGLVDEIIVVDTGSKDRTREVARSLGATVLDFPWDEDFSLARNYALEQAQYEWILVLDADEVVDTSLLGGWEPGQDGAEGYFIRVINLLGPEQKLWVDDLVVRLFRNRPGYRFIGPIHEQVKHTITALGGNGALALAPLTIYHRGYLPEIVAQKKKHSRNCGIIQRALARTPHDPFLWYSLGSEFFSVGRYEEALASLLKSRENLAGATGYLEDVVLKTAVCLYQLGKKEEILALLSESEEETGNPDCDYLRGLVLLETARYGEARQFLKRSLEGLARQPAWHRVARLHLVYQALGEAWEGEEMWEESLRCYQAALSFRPQYLYPLKRMVEVCRKSGRKDYVANQLSFPSSLHYLSLLDWDIDADLVLCLMVIACRDAAVLPQETGRDLAATMERMMGTKSSNDLRVRAAKLVARALCSLISSRPGHQIFVEPVGHLLHCLVQILLWEGNYGDVS